MYEENPGCFQSLHGLIQQLHGCFWIAAARDELETISNEGKALTSLFPLVLHLS